MQERRVYRPVQINDDLLRFTLRAPPAWFWVTVAGLALVVAAGGVGFGLMILFGLGVLGYTNTTYWTVQIVNFVYWSGVSHAGVVISAVLRLTDAEWRRPITRAAEVLTIFALVVAATFPITHTGRLWRTLYWFFPYDFARDVWPNVRSALIWDWSAILTYLTATLLYLYVTLLPDLAVIRDRSTGWPSRFYGLLALGFRGSSRQWRLHTLGVTLLSVVILAIFISDHSIVAWDFAVLIVPGWHTTILGPYFLIGAIHAGVAALTAVMAALRWIFRLDGYITEQHFDALGRLMLLISSAWLFSFIIYFYFDLFNRGPIEIALWELRLFTWPYTILFPLFIFAVFVIPFPFWLTRRLRCNVKVMFWTSLSATLGIWLERYLLVITPQSFKHPFVFTWIEVYEPRLIEWVLMAGTIALVLLGILLFAKLFPIISLFETKEGRELRHEVQIGRVRVPALVRPPEQPRRRHGQDPD